MSHLIEIRDLRKIYALGEEPVAALDGVSLTIEQGEFVAIMGASGSGKSTMLNILGCLDTPTSGSYLLDGIEVARRSRAELARRLGLLLKAIRTRIGDNAVIWNAAAGRPIPEGLLFPIPKAL